MKRKINLTESDIRKIVRRVILKNENNFLLEKDAKKKEKEEPVKKETPKTKNYSYEDLIKSTGNTDNLAAKSSGSADRGATIVQGAAAAGGVTAGVGGIIGAVSAGEITTAAIAGGAIDTLAGAAVLASNPVGWGVLGIAAIAGLYYVFGPETTGTNATKEALDTTLYERVYAGFKSIYKELKQSEFEEIRNIADRINPKVCLKVPSEEEATTIAEKIYEATQGSGSSYLSTALGAISGGYLAGAGTDEAGIKAALKECKSYLGVSLVSKKHAEMYEGVIDDGNLLKVFTSELDRAEMEKNVNSVIKTLPYIIINDKEYDKEEFQEWLLENKRQADEFLIKLKEDLEKAGEEEEGGETEDVVPPFVELIQRSINRYCAKNNLDYTPLKEDNVWGPRTNALWKDIYLPHVLTNHSVFSEMNIDIGDSKWKNISAQLIDAYPGYTAGAKGCARFCIDALYDNTTQGEKEGGSDSPIKYFKGGERKPERGEKESIEKKDVIDQKEDKIEDNQPYDDGRLTYKNIKIDVDTVGDRSIKKLSQLPGAPSDADSELKWDFLTNFGTGRLDVPPGQTFQLHIMPQKNGKIKLQHISKKWFKERGIRKFADPFYRFFLSLNMSEADIKRITKNRKAPIVVKVIMPGGLYNPAVDR